MKRLLDILTILTGLLTVLLSVLFLMPTDDAKKEIPAVGTTLHTEDLPLPPVSQKNDPITNFTQENIPETSSSSPKELEVEVAMIKKEKVSLPQKTNQVVEINTPGPLYKQPDTGTVVVSGTSSQLQSTTTIILSTEGELNQLGIFTIVNEERKKNGLPVLRFSVRLSAIAEAKAVDMIYKKYFAHVSPIGVDIAGLAQQYGYAYLNIGENLALGDFLSSKEVMEGWMNSPGHRANILSKNFTEIGISALRGDYQGREVWYAVQEFGRPQSDCPSPDKALLLEIEDGEDRLSTLGNTLAQLHAELTVSKSDYQEYLNKLQMYNVSVREYNTLLSEVKGMISRYNEQISTFNNCADGIE